MRVFAFLGMLLTLAGCVAPPPTEAPADEVEENLRYGECDGVESFSPVPIDDARAKLPDGYEPVPVDQVGATAALVVAIARCGSVVLKGADLGPGDHGFAAIQVEPPADRAGDADIHVVILWQMVGHEDERAAMTRWGHPSVVMGTSTLTDQDLPGGRRTMHAEIESDSAEAASESAFPEQLARMEPYTVRFHSVEGAPILDIALDGDDYLEGVATTTIGGVGFDGPRQGIAYYRAPDPLLVEMRPARVTA